MSYRIIFKSVCKITIEEVFVRKGTVCKGMVTAYISNGSHIFSAFHCARAAQINVVYAELCLPARQRAGQRATYTSVKEPESSYSIYPLFWRHWILVALVKPEAVIPRMKGFTSVKRVSASVVQGSPILEGFLVLHDCCGCHAGEPSQQGQGVIGPVAVALVKKNKNIEIGH